MAKTLDEAIAELNSEITKLEADIRGKKQTVNTLCQVDGREPMYVLNDAAESVPTRVRSDQFYGQPLAPSVRTILEMRRQQNLGAATVNEIFDALTHGGYQFNTKSDDVARNSLRNSLAKNTPVFHKLPNGRFGLTAWYPNARQPTRSAASNGTEIEDAEEEDDQTQEAATEPATAS